MKVSVKELQSSFGIGATGAAGAVDCAMTVTSEQYTHVLDIHC